jgi:hypothetical protein
MTANPSAVWVGPTRVRPSRLAAEFYRQEYTDLEDQLDRSGHRLVVLGKLGRLFTGPFGSKLPASLYDTPNGVPLLRVQNIGNIFLNETDIARIPLEVHEDIHRSKLEPGDLALAKAGRLGALSKIPAHIQECNITQHIVGVKVRADKVRGSYLAAFFLSRFGSFQLKRQGIGTLIKYLGIEETRAAKVVVPDRRIQDYIGAKVELAERCRSHSAKLQSRAMELLAQSWAWGNRGPAELQDQAASQVAHTVEPRIFEDRLDPEFYRPSFLAVDRWLDGQPCWCLSELVEAPVKGVQPSYDPDGSVPALTVTHVDPFVLDRNEASGLVTDAWLSRNARARIEAGELLYTITGPPLGETVVVEEFHLPAAVNSHVARVALRPHFKFPHLVAGMLNSPLGQLQTTRYSKGIRQKELYFVDFVRFRFPKLLSQTCTRLERDLAASCRLVEEARVLIEEAKADVEALIEGTLDVEAILIGTVKASTADDIPELAEDDA